MLKAEWDALSNRIVGLIEAATFLFHCRESDEAFSTNVLIESCKQTAAAIRLLSSYRSSMSVAAAEALQRFEEWWRQTDELGKTGFQGVMAYAAVLAAFRSELDHLFANREALLRSRVARAFLHLQRSLVADEDIRNKWQAAFDKGELACEKLGALHLLAHGVLAFKANSTGERTDLILGDRLVPEDDTLTATHGLVLTEWKLVRRGEKPEAMRNFAKEQAQRYSEGCVAGFELRSERYLVLVGCDEFSSIPSERIGDIVYRTIPIYLNRQTPSRVTGHL